MRNSWLIATVLCLTPVTHPSAQNNQLATDRRRPSRDGGRGASACGEAGMRILRAGGNAIDAAMATWAVQGEVEPGMTGLGADMLVLIYLAKTGEVKFINATGEAPQAATIDFYKVEGRPPRQRSAVRVRPRRRRRRGLRRKTTAPSRWPTSWRRPSRLPRGLPHHRRARARPRRRQGRSSPSGRRRRRCGSRTGSRCKMGDVLVKSGARAHAPAIATQGPDAFYKGAIAKTTAAILKANGGIITEADLAGYQPYEDAPIRVNYRGTDVYECPPNSQGFVMLEALNILEGYDLRRDGPQQRRPTCTRSPRR